MIPIVSRLELADYFRLAYALIILAINRILLFVWPVISPYIDSLYRRDRKDLFVMLQDTCDLIKHFGHSCEEHVLFTEDGQLLTLFKIAPRETSGRPPVLFLHGAMLSSDIWLIHRDEGKNLPLFLAANGYEVWLGNRRGNKYCGKHKSHGPGKADFWNWSLDEVALFDIPAMVGRVLSEYGKGMKCIIIGFSQGSAELMASLSLLPELNEKVGLAVGLAAITRPSSTLSGPSIISALIHGPPQLLSLIFGNKMMLASVLFWMDALPAPVYVKMIDSFLSLLFGWTCANIEYEDRLHMYMKLYSYSSVKAIAHWFQMARSGRFQMFDESSSHAGSGRPGHLPLAYPLRQIKSPLVLFNGEQDTLSDPAYTRSCLGDCLTEEIVIPLYEHLDFLMARNVDTAVFPRLLQILSKCKTVVKAVPNGVGSPRSPRRTSELSVTPSERLFT
jgi:lysosomal acid lipase/cholesteryl ester hydrolase